MRLAPQTTVLDIACGTAGPALVLAREFGCRIHGVDVSAVFIEAARRRIADAGSDELISVEIADAAQVSEWPSRNAALCLGAAFVWGHIGDAAAVLAQTVGGGRTIAVGEPFSRETGRDQDGFVDLQQTVARFEAPGVDLTGMVAASDDDWDRYKSPQWRAELGWAIFIGRVR
jgi:predicted TPR repeat methyltransferase